MSNICSFCGKPFDFSNRVVCDVKGKPLGCEHDGVFLAGPHFSEHDRKIIDKLPSHQVLAKGPDGISRICNRQ